jgi:hypothetical protein
VHVGRGWAAHLDVHVVDVAHLARRVTGLGDRGRLQVDATDEGDLALLTRVDEPALLVVAELPGQHVPASAKARIPVGEGAALRLGPEEVDTGRLPLLVE